MLIPRLLSPTIASLLDEFPAVGLLGPRQVGKTTLARGLKRPGSGSSVYLDLESPADLARLDDPLGYLTGQRGRLVVIDEVQRKPEIFQVLRGLIDERVLAGEPAGHFLLLGSASIDLLRQSSETLAGRIVYREMSPLDVREIEADEAERLWLRGGFPRSFLASSDAFSATWRESFIKTYLERDIPQLGSRIPAETLRQEVAQFTRADKADAFIFGNAVVQRAALIVHNAMRLPDLREADAPGRVRMNNACDLAPRIPDRQFRRVASADG